MGLRHEVRVVLTTGADVRQRRGGHGPPRAVDLASIPAARRTVFAASDPLAHADLRTLAGEPVLEGHASHWTSAWLARARELGAQRLQAVVGGIRRKVHESLTDTDWQQSMQGIANATMAGFDVHVIAPVWRDNLADLVPLAEWLLALPSRIGGFFPWIPPLTVPGPHASRSAIAEQCAASFEQARRKKIRTGFADPLALPPCAAEGHLDRFGWVFQDRVRRQQQTSADFVRAPACGECSLASACPGIEPAFQRDVLVPVPLETSMGWQAKPRDFEEDDYRHISAFDNHDGPGRGLLRINGHCQMACSFCFVDRRVGDFPRESLEDAIASLASRQRDHLVLSGGEPTLHPELPALIATARDAGFKGVEIQSNGVRLADPEKVDQLVAAGLTKATISLHSVDPAESDAITKMKGAHPKTLEGIRQLRRAGVETQLAHVLTKRNYRALPEFVRTIGELFPPAERKISLCLALAQGISDLVYSWVIPSFREVKPFVKEALDHCLDIGIGFGGLIGQGGYPPCMLDGDLRYYEGNLRHVYRSHDHRDQFHKAPRCQRCSFNPHCVGVRKDYVRCYGDDEITPFSERRRLPLV